LGVRPLNGLGAQRAAMPEGERSLFQEGFHRLVTQINSI
jgi:hypothetical protein